MSSEDFLVAPGEYGDVYDRARTTGTVYDRVLRREGKMPQAAEENEESTILRGKISRVGDMVARAGDRVSGAGIVVDIDAQTATLAAGEIYVRGDVRPVPAAVLSSVPVEGDVAIGVYLNTSYVDHEDDATLVGLHPGSVAEGEDGAVREVVTLTWGFAGDGGQGTFYQVYLLRDGYVVDQTPPPSLSGINQAIGVYDREAHGNYIARGCEVLALGTDGAGNQVFSIAEGSANILGAKRTRNVATRHVQAEEPDLRAVDNEPHTFGDGGSGTAVIEVNRTPINGVTSVIVTKQATEVIVRGGTANGSDLLSNSSVTTIVSVVQGETTFTATTDYVRDGDRVSWAPGGTEPAASSSYTVTYQYLAAVTPDAVSATSVTVTGGVTDTAVFIDYTHKLPRFDRICLDEAGNIVYLKGLSAIEQPRAPRVPSTLLALAVVKNDWFGTPTVENTGTRAIPFETQTRFFNRLVEMIGLASEDRLKSDIALNQPVAKYGIFVDPFENDRYRDAGVSQNGAVFQGSFQLPVEESFQQIAIAEPVSLDFTEVIAVSQEWVTGCMKINPYQNFTPPPPRMRISPAQDFWVETNEVWSSPATQVFGNGNASRVVSTEVITSVETVTARFLRQIEVNFTIEDFGNGEELTELTFDGIDVTPAGPLTANSEGVVTGSFTIPANVAAGTRLVRATGGTPDRETGAIFTGQGRIDTIRRQQLTTVEQFQQVQQPTWSTLEWQIFNGLRDPLAQSFALDQSQHISGVDVKFCAIGDRSKPCSLQLVTMENGFPTTEVLAQARIDMGPVIVGQWTPFNFPVPVYVPTGQQFAFVVMTDDADHSLSIASREGFDAVQQKFVGAQPYTVGVLFSSSNRQTWTPHQDDDLTFRLRAARFAPTTKTIPLGTFAVTEMSDLIIEAGVYLPTDATRVLFEVQPAGENAVLIEPGAVWERSTFFTGNVTVKALLSGSTMVSPVMGRDALMIKGVTQATGVYVSRVFEIGENKTVNIELGTRIPAGATLTVSLDDGEGGGWTPVAQTSARVLTDGSLERLFQKTEWAGPNARVKLEYAGTTPAHGAAVVRPTAFSLRVYSID